MSERPSDPPRGFYNRGYLPHLDMGEWPQFVTFCLADAVPPNVRGRIDAYVSSQPPVAQARLKREAMEAVLDEHRGAALLRGSDAANAVADVLLANDTNRCRLHAWVIMPNHVHLLLTPMPDVALAVILQRVKGASARAANRVLRRSGTLWQHESWDTAIRSDKHFETVVEYIEFNPVKAGLCERPEDWPHGSASRRG
jgi:REP element-mobilizing transposase RayT